MNLDRLDAKTLYAQTSDIRGRTYLEYRRDMKKKAIAELEVREWLENKIKEMFPGKCVKVEKSGGDKFLWFLRKGGVSREPDFVAIINGENLWLEFQYAEKEDLKFYDFKVSKVARKSKGERSPIPNKLFIYIQKPTNSYAFLEPSWIMENGKIGMVEAWRSEAYRVPKEKFEEKLLYDPSLEEVCQVIDAKVFLLNFQHGLIDIYKERLSTILQNVVDEEKIVKIVPKDMESFFKVCFILDSLNKTPLNKSLWLCYVLSYVRKGLRLEDISKLVYCIDFLFSKIEKLKPNELDQLVPRMKELLQIIRNYYSSEIGYYLSSADYSPVEETRFAIFSINLLEDLVQDVVVNYSVPDLRPIRKIYENIPDPKGLYKRLTSSLNSSSEELLGKG
ncbi:MAG: hypothetical protein ACP5QS_02400 [bacterium]